MKKILTIIAIITMIGCSDDKPKVVRHIDKEDRLEWLKHYDPIQYEVEINGCKTWMEYAEKIKKRLKNWPFPNANGEWLIMRTGDKPDTIVDGIGYRRF